MDGPRTHYALLWVLVGHPNPSPPASSELQVDCPSLGCGNRADLAPCTFRCPMSAETHLQLMLCASQAIQRRGDTPEAAKQHPKVARRPHSSPGERTPQSQSHLAHPLL